MDRSIETLLQDLNLSILLLFDALDFIVDRIQSRQILVDLVLLGLRDQSQRSPRTPSW